MSNRIMSLCWQLSDMSGTEKCVLIALADIADDSGLCWPSIATIAERTCFSDRAVQKAVSILSEKGYLKKHVSSGGKTNKYTIHPEPRSPSTNANMEIKGEPRSPLPRTTFTPNDVHPRTTFTVTPNDVRPDGEPRSPKPSRTIKEPSISIKRPDEVSETAWRDWLKVRKEKKAPLTETAWKAMLREVDKAGWSIGDAIAHCAEKSWQGFRADWVAEKPQAERKNGSPPWWISEATIVAKGREIGLNARPGESMDSFKGRINVALGAQA